MKRDPIDAAIEEQLRQRWQGNSDNGTYADQPYKTHEWYRNAVARRSRRGQFFRRLRRLAAKEPTDAR